MTLSPATQYLVTILRNIIGQRIGDLRYTMLHTAVAASIHASIQ